MAENNDTTTGTGGAGENKNRIDLKNILLPKKEAPGHTPESAQRVNAGALLEQELAAGREGIPGQPMQASEPAEPAPQAPEPPSPAPTPAPGQPAEPAARPAAPAEAPLVVPLETYKGDIAKVVQEQNVSMVSVAAAEAQRRGAEAGAAAPAEGSRLRTALMAAAGVVLIAAAAGALAFALYRPAAPQARQAPPSTIIPVDGTQTVVVAPSDSRSAVMQRLNDARKATALAVGLISRLWVAAPTSTPAAGNALIELSAQALLARIAPDAPAELLRALNPGYLLGVHVYGSNSPFFIFKVNSYEQAYAGMLAWEPSLEQDLLPLFAANPSPHVNTTPAPAPGATSSASSTPSTPAAVSPSIPQLVGEQTPFVDAIVQNHDARVIKNKAGDIVLLWTFLDKNTLVITTSPETLREIITRLGAPVVQGQ